jgi:hypothetical protein
MSITIGGVPVEEMRDGFEEGVDGRGPHGTKKYLCGWAGRYAVANALLGYTTGAGSGGPIVTVPPMSWPESPNMFVSSITIAGAGKSTQGPVQIQFEKAIVTANYGSSSGWSPLPLPNMSIDPGSPFTYATQELDFGRESITIEKSAVFLANGNRLKNQNYAVPLPHAILTIQLQRVPYLPAQAILVAMGKPLNSVKFLGVDPGYLMFDGAKSHMEVMTDGSYSQNLGLVFRVRPVLRWDEVYGPAPGDGPQQVRYGSAAGPAILLRTDLSTLIPSAYGGNGP